MTRARDASRDDAHTDSGGARVPVGRVPVPADVRTLLVYGGTFDPPHAGHAALPTLAREAAGADWVLYVPAPDSGAPLRGGTPGASFDDRVAMLLAALAGKERVSIGTIEAESARAGERAYTVDTLRTLRDELPKGVSMRLLIGADQAAQFHKWKDCREVVGLAPPLVMLRTPHESARALLDAMAPHWSADELRTWAGWIVPVPMIDADATRVRRALSTGCAASPDAPELAALLPEPVRRVIRERGLYR